MSAPLFRELANRLLNRRWSRFDREFLDLLDCIVAEKIAAEFSRRDAEEKAIWAEAFANGTALHDPAIK
jgi:hypothetical protein